MNTFIPTTPGGVTPPSEYDRRPIKKVFGGDVIELRSRVRLANGDPATEDNSTLLFRLTDQRFAETCIWEGRWRDGIERVPDTEDMIEIKVPASVSAELRRGSFIYSLLLTNALETDPHTLMEGHILVEYTATSPQKNIPYKDDNDLTAASDGAEAVEE